MNFTCPTNQVLNGVYSYYVGAANDRLWRFLCCETPRRYTTNCYFTQLTNTGQEAIWHKVGAPRVFSGAYSLYNHKKKYVDYFKTADFLYLNNAKFCLRLIQTFALFVGGE